MTDRPWYNNRSSIKLYLIHKSNSFVQQYHIVIWCSFWTLSINQSKHYDSLRQDQSQQRQESIMQHDRQALIKFISSIKLYKIQSNSSMQQYHIVIWCIFLICQTGLSQQWHHNMTWYNFYKLTSKTGVNNIAWQGLIKWHKSNHTQGK